MRQLRGFRVLTALALVVPASAAAWSVGGPADAAAVPVKCSVLNATLTGTGTVSKCTVPASTGTSGKLLINIAKKSGAVTWNKTGTSTFTIAYTAVKSPKGKLCAKGSSEILFSGKITGGTGAAVKAMPTGQKITANVCVGKAVTLKPGTVITL